ncbi:MAG: hypothetical protein M9928_13435 [Anaerolineae bacterium]|nr:hypothetical protein [Anaerolineae bacterium]MCO5194248.1 hypothetical protein [Anaerolineae bacterium]MCO5199564.1 hypothetical protein [Anaerolineae bacterium]MCO5206033.1 hypothetical protein [Anaerolineae bacterium]
MEAAYNVDIEGDWSSAELALLRAALDDASSMFGGAEQLQLLIEAARRNNAVSVEQLSITRVSEGRASYRQGGALFQILLGDETFDSLNYTGVPFPSRPGALDVRNEHGSAKITMLHELMHVVIDARPDILQQYRKMRQWNTDDASGPQDERRSFALVNLTHDSGPEEDLVIAMALYAHAYAPDAQTSQQFYMDVMYDFHMTFVWTAWELPGAPPGRSAENDDNNQQTSAEPICRLGMCDMP